MKERSNRPTRSPLLRRSCSHHPPTYHHIYRPRCPFQFGQRHTLVLLEQEQTHPQEYPGHERLGMTQRNLEQETLQQLLLGHPPLEEQDQSGLRVQQGLFLQLEQPPVKHVASKQTIVLPTDGTPLLRSQPHEAATWKTQVLSGRSRWSLIMVNESKMTLMTTSACKE